jgi:hypothetical protein
LGVVPFDGGGGGGNSVAANYREALVLLRGFRASLDPIFQALASNQQVSYELMRQLQTDMANNQQLILDLLGNPTQVSAWYNEMQSQITETLGRITNITVGASPIVPSSIAVSDQTTEDMLRISRLLKNIIDSISS